MDQGVIPPFASTHPLFRFPVRRDVLNDPDYLDQSTLRIAHDIRLCMDPFDRPIEAHDAVLQAVGYIVDNRCHGSPLHRLSILGMNEGKEALHTPIKLVLAQPENSA